MKMSEHEFNEYYADKLERYAQVLDDNVHEVGESGEIRAKKQLASLLPDGLSTTQHEFYTIQLDDERIGYVWIKIDLPKQTAFLYEIYIFEAYQSNGYGKEVMYLIEKMLTQQSVVYFKLHVFGSNTRAIDLYNSIGFHALGINMVKELK